MATEYRFAFRDDGSLDLWQVHGEGNVGTEWRGYPPDWRFEDAEFHYTDGGEPKTMTGRQWDRMTREKQGRIAFENIGCVVAFPSWWQHNEPYSTCSHPECKIRRGEYGAQPEWLVRFNLAWRAQTSRGGWLHDHTKTAHGRHQLARLYWALKATRQVDILACVWVGVLA